MFGSCFFSTLQYSSIILFTHLFISILINKYIFIITQCVTGTGDEEENAEDQYLARLDAGLFKVQMCDLIVAALASNAFSTAVRFKHDRVHMSVEVFLGCALGYLFV